MTDQDTQLTGPAFTKGVLEDLLADGAALVGHAFGEPVLLVRVGVESSRLFFGLPQLCRE